MAAQKKYNEEFQQEVIRKERRKLRARKSDKFTAWFGLGSFGLIGWSVALPTVLFTALGVWIDGRWPSRYSWTLMFLVIGVCLGCYNGWFWMNRERKIIEKEREEGSDE